MLNLVRKKIRCPRSPHLRSRLDASIYFNSTSIRSFPFLRPNIPAPSCSPRISLFRPSIAGRSMSAHQNEVSKRRNELLIKMFEFLSRCSYRDSVLLHKSSTEKFITLSKVCPFLKKFKAKIEIVKDFVIKVSIGPPSIPRSALNSLPSRREASDSHTGKEKLDEAI